MVNQVLVIEFIESPEADIPRQIEYHPYLLAHLAPVLAIQAQHGIVTEAFGPLTPAVRHPTGGPLRPFLSQIAQRLHKESGKAVDDTSVLLLWTKAKGVVAVSASGNPENIKQIALAQTLPDLTKEEVAEIDRIGASIHFRHYVSASFGNFCNMSHRCLRQSTWRPISQHPLCLLNKVVSNIQVYTRCLLHHQFFGVRNEYRLDNYLVSLYQRAVTDTMPGS